MRDEIMVNESDAKMDTIKDSITFFRCYTGFHRKIQQTVTEFAENR